MFRDVTYCVLHRQMRPVRTHRRCERRSGRFLPQQSSRERARSRVDVVLQRSVMHPAPRRWSDRHRTFGRIIACMRIRVTVAVSFVTVRRSKARSSTSLSGLRTLQRGQSPGRIQIPGHTLPQKGPAAVHLLEPYSPPLIFLHTCHHHEVGQHHTGRSWR